MACCTSRPVLHGVVQLRLRQFASPIVRGEKVIVAFEQDIDHLCDLPAHVTERLHASTVLFLFRIINAESHHQAAVESLPGRIISSGGKCDQVHGLLQERIAALVEHGTVDGRARLRNAWCPTQIPFQTPTCLEIGDGSNPAEKCGCLDGADTHKGCEYASFTRFGNDLLDVSLQLVNVAVEETQFDDQLPLFDEQAEASVFIFDANGGRRKHLQPCQCVTTWHPVQTRGTQVVNRSISHVLRGWKLFAQGKSRWGVWVSVDFREFGEQFVTNGRELILALRRLPDQFGAVLDQATKTAHRDRWGQKWANTLHLVRKFNVQFQMVVEHAGQRTTVKGVSLDLAAIALPR